MSAAAAPCGRPALPAASFAELAFELKLVINREASMNRFTEEFCARLEMPSPSLQRACRDFELATERLADLYRLVLALIPLEPKVRALCAAAAEAADA